MKKVVIIGAGFGGVYTAKKLLKRKDISVTIISRKDYFTYTPLLHEFAAGFLKEYHVVKRLENIFKGRAKIIIDSAQSIDIKNKIVKCSNSNISFDYLVIATGAHTKFFQIPGAQEYSYELKTVEDARKIYEKISSMDKGNVIVGGGGATGIEISCEISEYLKKNKSNVKVTVIQGGERILPAFSETTSKIATRRLVKLGINIVLNSKIAKVSKNYVILDTKEKFLSDMTIWTTGTEPNFVNMNQDVKLQNGCLVVDKKMNVLGRQDIFSLGDVVVCYDDNHMPYPYLAQTAVAQSKTVAHNLIAQVKGKKMKDFNFKYRGTIISLGRYCSVGNPLGIPVLGHLPWIIKKTYYRMQLNFL